MDKKIPSVLAIGIVLILALIIGGFIWLGDKQQLTQIATNNQLNQNNKITTVPVDWQTYKNKEFGFELRYPSELSLKNDERPEMKLSNVQQFRNLKTDCLLNLEFCATPAPIFSVIYFKKDKNINILELIREKENMYGELNYEKINISSYEFIRIASGDMYLGDNYYIEKNGIVINLRFYYDTGNNKLQLNDSDTDKILSTFKFIR